MSIIRNLVINSLTFLSFMLLPIFVFRITSPEVQHEQLHLFTIPPHPWFIANITGRPFIRHPGLPLPFHDNYPPKCVKYVPAIFFQYEKDVPIIGNATGNPFFNEIEVCCKGYKRYDYDWSRCVPDCGNKCLQNGYCHEGGICECFKNFVMNYRNECVRTCPLDPPHGRCLTNGTFECKRGFELDPTKKFCLPQCDPVCGLNELCSATDQCVCMEGYRNSTMGCQPICIPDCAYGYCVAPNHCECFPGYTKRFNGTICEENCYMSCQNGFCANRTTCKCYSGYKYDQNSTACLPNCDDKCENGICISPGNCRCFNGYVRNREKCVAVCERGCGFYGKCIAPNFCGCAIVDGPLKSYQQCQEGHCNAKGRCRCMEGTTRFINRCIKPDEVTTYASSEHDKLNHSLHNEFHLLIGKHFLYIGAQRY